MTMTDLAATITAAWDNRAEISPTTGGDVRAAVAEVLAALDRGNLRAAMKREGVWQANAWVKQAILLSFRLEESKPRSGGYDKVPLKWDGWGETDFKIAGFRAVPGAVVRKGAYIAPGVVLMPSFVNIGAYVGPGTMIDTWATVGSCAQIGANCHISGGAGIGGVLEPLQAAPVVIEDNVFIGARSEVAEGVHVGAGAVLAMGVYLGASTKIIDRASGEVFIGRVPEGAVVVPGSQTTRDGLSLYCAVIVKRVDAQTRAKTSINELLRD
jgi:2,3,4,5-tetrahydropyridine-2-carboxylate N-succinyltransferase